MLVHDLKIKRRIRLCAFSAAQSQRAIWCYGKRVHRPDSDACGNDISSIFKGWSAGKTEQSQPEPFEKASLRVQQSNICRGSAEVRSAPTSQRATVSVGRCISRSTPMRVLCAKQLLYATSTMGQADIEMASAHHHANSGAAAAPSPSYAVRFRICLCRDTWTPAIACKTGMRCIRSWSDDSGTCEMPFVLRERVRTGGDQGVASTTAIPRTRGSLQPAIAGSWNVVRGHYRTMMGCDLAL